MTPESASRLCMQIAAYIEASKSPSRIVVSSDLRALIYCIESGTTGLRLVCASDATQKLMEDLNKKKSQLKLLAGYLLKGSFLPRKGQKIPELPKDVFSIFSMLYAKSTFEYKRWEPKSPILKDIEKWKTDPEFKEGWSNWVRYLIREKKSAKDALKELKNVLQTIQNFYQAINAQLKELEHQKQSEQESDDSEPDSTDSLDMARFRDEPDSDQSEHKDELERDDSDSGDSNADQQSDDIFDTSEVDEFLKSWLDVGSNPPRPTEDMKWVKLDYPTSSGQRRALQTLLNQLQADYDDGSDDYIWLAAKDYRRFKQRQYV